MPRKSKSAITTSGNDEADTRERILAAASKLFADRGFDGATLRDITDAARANLAAVNYYFRSKDELIRSTLEAALRPIVGARLSALEKCERDYPGRTIPLEKLVDALVRPMAALSSGENRDRLVLLLQVRTIARAATSSIVVDHFKPLHERFIDALQKTLPHLSRAELALRYDSARGATLQILVDLAPAARLVVSPAERAATLDHDDQVIAGLCQFVAAGFRAPAAISVERDQARLSPETRKRARR